MTKPAKSAEPAPERARWRQSAGPLAIVVAIILVLWYLAAIGLNAPQTIERFERDHLAWTARDLVASTWSMGRPVLPAPHQIAADLIETIFLQPVTSPKSLLYHTAVTSAATLTGFILGTLLGVLLAILIVHSRTLDRGMLPWIIASQAVPILAIAPIVVVIFGNLGFSGLAPKAFIAMYLCFFPVTVAMVQGLRSAGVFERELLYTYAATASQSFWRLKLPAALPFLFPSLRVAIAAGLVGAIVAELPTGAQAGLGARMLAGSYYGNTAQIWSALLMSAVLGLALTGLVGATERRALRPWRGDPR